MKKTILIITLFLGLFMQAQLPAEFIDGIDVKGVIKVDFQGVAEGVASDSITSWDGTQFRWVKRSTFIQDLQPTVSSKNLSFGESYISNYRDRVLDQGATYFPNHGGYDYGLLAELGLEWDMSLMMIPSAVAADSLSLVKGSPNFTFGRNSTATYVDPDGIVQTAPINTPRIDYSDGEGVFLKEPQSTNVVRWSEDLTNAAWVPSVDMTIGEDLIQKDAIGTKFLQQTEVNVTNGVTCALQFRIKNVDATQSQIWLRASFTSTLFKINWTGSELTSISEFTGISYETIPLNDDWYHVKVLYTSGEVNQRPKFYPELINNTGAIRVKNIQIEDNISSTTSYMPTQSSTVTRLSDQTFGAGNVNTFNSLEGTLYVEMAALTNDSTNRYITISDGTSSNRLIFKYDDSSNTIQALIISTLGTGGVVSFTVPDILDFQKVGFKYKENDFALWIDGVEVATDNTGVTFSENTLNILHLADSNGVSNPMFFKSKSIIYFKKALTDNEYQLLTKMFGMFLFFRVRKREEKPEYKQAA